METIEKQRAGNSFRNKRIIYIVFIIAISFLLNLLGGEVSIAAILGTLIGSIVLAYPVYYLFQTIRYGRFRIDDKELFELGVLRVAAALALIVCISIFRVGS